MDIDISDFSKKAKKKLLGQIILPAFALAACLYIVFSIGNQALINYLFNNYTGFIDPSKELIFLNVFASVAIAALIAHWRLNRRLETFNHIEYFSVCYECGHQRESHEIECPECGFDFKPKKLNSPVETVSGMGRKYINILLILMLVVSPTAAAFFKVLDVCYYRDMHKVNSEEMNAHIPGSKVIFKNMPATVINVGISTRHHVDYTIDVNGQKIYGVTATELQKNEKNK